MENQDKIYQQFKEAAGRTEDKGFARMDAVWNRVEEKLDNKKQRRISAWWKYTGIAAIFLLFMGTGLFMLNNEKNNPVVAPTVTPQNNVTVIDTQKVKETFDPAKAEPKKEVVTNETVQPPYMEQTNSTVEGDSIKFVSKPKKSLIWNLNGRKTIVKGYRTATKPMTIEDAAIAASTSYGASYKITGDTIFYTNGAKAIVIANNKIRIWESRTGIGEFRIKGEITERKSDETYYVKGARFTTSKNIKDPEYYFLAKKIKLIPGKNKPQETDDLSKGYATASPTDDVSFSETPNAESVKTKDTEQTAFADVQPAAAKAAVVDESKKVSGIITDSAGMPIPGVTVIVAGTTKAVSADMDGKYLIDAKEGEKLIASFIGMQQQTVTLGKRKENVNFQMKDDAQSLQEVVVEGYRTTTRATSNIAVATVAAAPQSRSERRKAEKDAKKTAKESESTSLGYNAPTDGLVFASKRNTPRQETTVTSKTIEGRPNANFIQTLQGQVPGLNVTTGSGQPGGDTDKEANDYNAVNGKLPVGLNYTIEENATANNPIAIRGAASIDKSIEPLYVIDGVPVSAEVFSKLDAKNISSVEVLKDAGATSIYGNRGKNGVIIVKTKKALTRKERKKLKEDIKNGGKQNPEYIHFMESSKPAPIEVDQEEYENFVENQFENPATTPLSTFSIDVDNASYTNIRRFLNNGETVPKDAVRVEEMINFFKYQYPQPVNNEPFSINTEYSDAPWNSQHKLLKIGLQGKIIPDENLPASNFVFLIDVSGSMNEANKLPLLKQSMKLLVNQMRKKDRIAIVVYAGAAGMVLPSTSGDEKEKIFAALENLSAGGSTAGGAGIELAYKTAEENFVKTGNNRVILATDGDFNVGASSNTDMQTLIEEKRKSGVFLTCLGYGMGNYKDSKLETLADKGNGNYAYIDNMQEADRYLNKEFKGSMYAIAKDVKIQIEFNPKHVQSYRLIGYENRKLRDEDFANDAIDAGELGSGHTVTALYEIIPVGIKSEFFNPAPELKYSQPKGTANQYNDELATIKFRSKKPSEDKSTEIVKIIPNNPLPLQGTSADYKFSAAVSWFGLKLRDSKLVPNKKTDDIKSLAKQGLQNDTDGYRAEFIRLADMVK